MEEEEAAVLNHIFYLTNFKDVSNSKAVCIILSPMTQGTG